jgi:uncharacterized protein YecT (DUF1311 family)
MLLNTACDRPEGASSDPCEHLDRVDREMLDLMEDVLAMHQDKPQFVMNMQHAHVMWIQYRDAMARVYMDAAKKPRNYSVDQKRCKCGIMAELTLRRIEELRFWLESFDPTKTCWDQ